MPDRKSSQSRPSSRAAKSSSTSAPQTGPETPSISASQNPLRQKKSKSSSLFSLFSRPNVEKARGHHEPMPLPPVAAAPPDIALERPSTRMSTRSSRSRPSSRLSFLSRNESPSRDREPQSRPTSRMERPSSRLSLRRIGSTITGKSTASSKPTSQTDRLRQEAPWDPPPLFQAYPQALKHTLLKSPGPSFDPYNPAQGYNQRHSDQKGGRGSIFGRPMSRQGYRSEGGNRSDKNTERWSKKVYVLVTSGHLLEYAGDGPYDRLPEKVLRLGSDSAAFASDLIPGFPYVLQVLQTASSGIQVVQLPQKSFRARIGLQSASSRRVASNILLVFNEPEPMDSWMIAIRREIENRGGRKSRPESTVVRNDVDEHPSPIQASASAVSRYESITRSSSRGSNYSSNLTARPSMRDMAGSPLPVINEGPSMVSLPRQGRDWPWSQPPAEPEPSSSDDYDSRAETSVDTLPTQESNSLSGDWFTDLPSTTALTGTKPTPRSESRAGDYPNPPYAGLPLSDRSSLEHSAHGQNLANGRPKQAAPPGNNKAWVSSFSKPRYSVAQQAYIQKYGALPTSTTSPMTSGRLSSLEKHYNHADKLGLGIQAYSDVSTASEISSANSNTISTRTSTITSSGSTTPTASAPPQATTPAPAPRAIPRNNGGTTTQLTPLLTSTYAQWNTPGFATPNLYSPSPSMTMNSPTLSSAQGRGSPSPPNVLKRPTSILIHSDPVPFLSAMAKTKKSPGQLGRHSSNGQRIPVVRPPSTNKGRSNQQRRTSGSGLNDAATPVMSSPLTSRSPSGMGWVTPGGGLTRSGAISPSVERSGAISPIGMRDGAISPNGMRSGAISPNGMRNGAVSPVNASRAGSVLGFTAKITGNGVVTAREKEMDLPPRSPPPTSPLPLPPGIAV